ncbi:MAG: polysaccharide pyruvyl transferase family protein [Tissierellia bacterium]|nr:polysaccharide pyruvyl transferase family protein [Tissierellia bacterium]
MKKKIKVLHIASFIGNIGDNANHKGASRLRDWFLDYEFEVTKKEIREFYWKEWIFNSDEFIEEANKHELVMIGGGNYFELWVNNSVTGTSIDISIETLKKIQTPILFYSLGCDIGQGFSSQNLYKFNKFLEHISNNNKYFISVRNDGALSNIISLFGQEYEKKISKIPDGGFFTFVGDHEHFEIEKDKKNIVVNVAGDMQNIRFSKDNKNISYNQFITGFAEILKELDFDSHKNYNFIFVPHIYRDLNTIYDLMNQMEDKLRRKCVKVAPYLIGEKGHDYIFSLYKQADLILGMRFHSNVCAYALKKNVIGLSNYIQINNLYKDINSNEFVEVNKRGFQEHLIKMIIKHLKDKDKYTKLSEDILNTLKVQAQQEYKKLNNWLKKFN